MADSLFNSASPLAARMRPRSLAEVVGQSKALAVGSPLEVLSRPAKAGKQSTTSVVIWGPPGTGKTTIAKAVANTSGRRFVELSAVSTGVKELREVIDKSRTDQELYSVSTIVFLDEIHRFTKAQQDALLPGVENGWVTLIAATTENPSFSVISPLLSRSLLLRLELLTDEELSSVVQTALAAPHGLAGNFRVEADAMTALVRLSSGDARRALTALDAAAAVALSRLAEASPPVEILGEDISRAVDRALLRYDRDGDEHYDVISAFIKSIRGSDPDAALHYLARMIEAGEDPRFIARRLIISAAEDIGLAQPQALPLAVAAADAVALIGMPEGRIPLAEATVYLATSPKSNAAYRGINEALTDVREGKSGVVPPHLRDASYAGAKSLGHGAGYVYPHNDPLGIVRQQYLPDSLAGRVYYNPTTHGQERDIAERLDRLRTILRGE